ncbi:MAG TPA: hypothetical protein VF897_21310 [Roseiflexaceae bacterium]
MLETLTFTTFAQQLNTPFQVERAGAVPLALELIEAREARSAPGYEAFSIVFRGPGDVFLPQAIYGMQHEAIGAFELFVVPIRQDQHGLYYEAIFNRPRTGGQG